LVIKAYNFVLLSEFSMGPKPWLSDLFESTQEYGKPSVALTGQWVRSKDEKTIADYFTRHGIAYIYEALATTGGWFQTKISRPDFYLPQYNLIVEYWGLVNSPDREKRDVYVRSMRWKMAKYRNNNFRFVSIYPSNLSQLDYYFRKKFREAVGFELPIPRDCPTCHLPIMDMPLHIKWHSNRTSTHHKER
jgi:hypothetical protein